MDDKVMTTDWTQDAAHIQRKLASPTDAIMSTYRYRPIVSDEEIRVLRLEPAANFADPLVGSLFVRTIHDACDPLNPTATYHCVSYCWGNSETTHSIQCDDQSLWITSNVDEMLRYLRKPSTYRNLWIDAICINQSDDIEKASQVGCMGLIYARAEKVDIWLGPAAPEDNISQVFSILRNRALDLHEREATNPNPAPEIFLAPVLSFLERPWFARRWILQEVKLARAARAHCGEHHLSWNRLRDGLAGLKRDFLRVQNRHTSTKSVSIAAVQALEAAASLHATGLMVRGPDILSLLWNYHSSKCSDERDRLFALYGLVSSDHSAGDDVLMLLPFEPWEVCPIDYSRHFTEIYTQLATAAVKKGLGSSVLSHCFAFGVLADQDPDWPSWVPSWNMSRQFQTIRSRDNFFYFEGDPVRIEQTNERPSIHAKGEKYTIVTIQKRRGEANESDNTVLQFFRTSLQAALRSNANWEARKIMAALLLRGIHTLDSQYDSEVSIQSIFTQKSGNAREGYSWSNEFDQIRVLMEEIEGKTLLRDSAGSYNGSLFGRDIDTAFKDCTLLRYSLYGTEAPAIAFGDITTGDYIFRSAGSETEWRKSTTALIIRPQKPHNFARHSSPEIYRIVGFCLDCYEMADALSIHSSHARLLGFTNFLMHPRESVTIF
ncbi:heterokaryon incompatibility protein-domain-containing protein [Paraphoma chrysanthemicola]|nr:heterokaryon incompatibility protein-domain-containing protein [Paraphoma chrysanthemicola]